MGDPESTLTEEAELVDQVELRLGAQLEHLSVVRAVAAHIAMGADFDIDAIADLKLAVDEVCTDLIVRAVPGSAMDCVFRLSPDRIEACVRVTSHNDDLPKRDSFGWTVLTTLTDSVSTRLESVDGHYVIQVDIAKNRTATT
ncbi:serine/threonine-protein kinase RsbW [Herbihabitans rhizosphaerae]|uniref:Serine/threonine-protein kinase RsbW n=1 Tax=Herbihabitans rhizosphaerae TaxID=1872711 RepID=A0A4V2ERR0_9PSEU|nr:ATP-binding protein [Herbihabitans rhizosphaerae]RZS32819.1 serine/threonine-protein kinase RsbW [Herbihabitans rhizosphaerae]